MTQKYDRYIRIPTNEYGGNHKEFCGHSSHLILELTSLALYTYFISKSFVVKGLSIHVYFKTRRCNVQQINTEQEGNEKVEDRKKGG